MREGGPISYEATPSAFFQPDPPPPPPPPSTVSTVYCEVFRVEGLGVRVKGFDFCKATWGVGLGFRV